MNKKLLTAILSSGFLLSNFSHGKSKESEGILNKFLSKEQIDLIKNSDKLLKQSELDKSVFLAYISSEKSFLEVSYYKKRDNDLGVTLEDVNEKEHDFYIPKGSDIKDYEITIKTEDVEKCLDYKTANDLAIEINSIVNGTFYGFTPVIYRNGARNGKTCSISVYQIKDSSNQI